MLTVLCRALLEVFPESNIRLTASSDEVMIRCKEYAQCKQVKPLGRISEQPTRLLLYAVLGLFKLPLLLRFKRTDIVFFNDIESLIIGWPIALYTHSFFYLHDSHNLSRRKGRLICQVISALVKKLLVITRARVDKLTMIGINNAQYFPNCVDPDFLPNKSFRKIDNKTIRFVCMSQITAWKRIDKSIEVFKMISGFLDEHQCFLDIYGRIGEGDPDKSELQQMLSQAMKADNRIKYHGYASNSADIFSAADVLINMSINEPFGLVLVEALHSGCYIISAEGEGPNEIIYQPSSGFIIKEELIALADMTVLQELVLYISGLSRQTVYNNNLNSYIFNSYKYNLIELTQQN